MVIRVAYVGTGNVGRTNPAFQLTGVCVSTPGKVGAEPACWPGSRGDQDRRGGRARRRSRQA
jgi:2,4-diaminopentanoate dehydrogenase